MDPQGLVGLRFQSQAARFTMGGRTFQSLSGGGLKANYFDVYNRDQFWISGPKKDGTDRLYRGSPFSVEVDPDLANKYWRDIKGCG